MSYTPKTIDTSHVTLGTELHDLIERLAENNHDHWAQKRLDEGWSYGPARDDKKKESPVLVPYGELPESEKEYDRKTVIEAIKSLMALGYDVTRNVTR